VISDLFLDLEPFRLNPPITSLSDTSPGARAWREFVYSFLVLRAGRLDLTEQLGGLAPPRRLR